MNNTNLKAKTYRGKQAIIIGNNIAGLLSARIVADYFESVIIIGTNLSIFENEELNPIPTLVAKAYRILDEFFPNIGYKLTQKGALGIDWAREFKVFGHIGWGCNSQVPSQIISVICTRTLLESTIQELLVENHPNIQFISGGSIQGFSYDLENQQITGITLDVNNDSEDLKADLVIDASDNSSTPQYLEKIGFSAPPETIVDPVVGCAIRRYRLNSNFPANLKAMLIRPFPPQQTKIGCLTRVEGDEFIVALGEYGTEFTSFDEETWGKLALELPISQLSEIISNAEPISEILVGKANPNRLRHYEQIKLPQNLVILGNAACLLSPFYGQDTTTNILSVKLLQEFLEEQKPLCDFAPSLAQSNFPFWSLSSNLDVRFPNTRVESNAQNAQNIGTKKSGLISDFLNWYSWKLVDKTTSDSTLYTLWLEVIHLLKSPAEFFNPSVIVKVLT